MGLAPGASLGPYRIEGQLGAGGMGVVYKAVQVNLQRVVALKVMKPELAADHDFVERFMREARAGAALSHQHVVAIHDADSRDGMLYLAFEFVPGGDLAQLLQRRGPLPAGEALRLIAECADGLQAIHAAGMLHRDLKPQNIFLDGAGRAKLGDLGLARHVVGDDRMTVTGAAMGTPAFMAPEQAEGVSDIDIRADIHALGGTLYTLLTGQLPFAAATPWAVVAKVMSQPPPDPRTVVPGVPAEVVRLMHRAMAKRREERFATPAELRNEVLRVAGTLLPGVAGAVPPAMGAGALPPTPATGGTSWPRAQPAGMAPTVVTTQNLVPPPSPAARTTVKLAATPNQATQHPTVPRQRSAGPVVVIAVVAVVAVAAAIAVALFTAPTAPAGPVVDPHPAITPVVVVQPPPVQPGPATTTIRTGFAPPVAVAATPSPTPPPPPPASAAAPVVDAQDQAGRDRQQAREKALEAKRAPLRVLDQVVTPPADIEGRLEVYAASAGPDDPDLKRWRAKMASIAALRQELGTSDADTGLRGADAAVVAKLDQLAALVGPDDPDVVALRRVADGPPAPEWASASGKDAYGRWCEVSVDGVVQRLRLCRAGTFTMGSPPDEVGRADDEVAHKVTLSDFWLADTPCTQRLWVAVMGSNPSYFTNDPSRPVEQVSWNDTQGFMDRLAAALGATAPAAAEDPAATDAAAAGEVAATAAAGANAYGIRLPTEAEWEYACRAGTNGPYGGDGVIADMGWTIPEEGEQLWAKRINGGDTAIFDFIRQHVGTGGYQTRAVRRKQANAWGLYDMHGNVWQWCQDAYRPYDPANDYDPEVDADADHPERVNRGGAWSHPMISARSAERAHDKPTTTDWAMGFRFAVSASATP